MSNFIDNEIPEGFLYKGPPKICPNCGIEFVPTTVRQIYCDKPCNEQAKYKARLERRKKKGLCPQCGGELTPGIPSKTERKAGNAPSYCVKCQEYFKAHHQSKKTSPGE